MILVEMFPFGQDAGGNAGSVVYGVNAGFVQGDRVKTRENSDVRHYGGVIFTMAIAIGRNLINNIDVEIRTSIQNRLAVFDHFEVDILVGGTVRVRDGMKITRTDAAPAANAAVVVNKRLFVFSKGNGAVGAEFCANPAANADSLLYIRFSAVVHQHFAGPAARSHTDIFDGAPKTCQFVSLEMVKGNQNIRIHYRPAYQGRFTVHAAGNGNFHKSQSADTIESPVHRPDHEVRPASVVDCG
jgi:hypothetical protein